MSSRWFSSLAPQPRSVYVARLRRAFLLRAHPDRFRSHEPDIRRKQADLVQAIGERLASPDVLAYTCGSDDVSWTRSSSFIKPSYSFVLEHKDGSLIHHTMKLQDRVENVLDSMAKALESTGNLSLPAPPPKQTLKSTKHPSSSPMHETLWAKGDSRDGAMHNEVDRRYDVNTYKGRDLIAFLKAMDHQLVEERRSHRMDVTAIALVARRAFHFLSIDGTGLGWSSASLTILLRSLVALYEEHRSKLLVDSFYPLRLVLSSDDFQNPIDIFGGILYLNPAATPMQWLDTLLLVTDDLLTTVRVTQQQLQGYIQCVQNGFGGVKFQRGHSCSSSDYHHFIQRLAGPDETTVSNDSLARTSNALALEGIIVTVEAAQACRRAVVTKEGMIRVGADMEKTSIASAISKLSQVASRKVLEEKEITDRCKQAIERAQWVLGLQKVYHTKIVRTEEVLNCLTRLLSIDEQDQLKRNLAGNALGIAGSGQFCHLGDDGSVIIPLDWR